MRIGFVGLGNMGTTVANLVAQNGYVVVGWDHDRKVIGEINRKHANSRYLKGIRLQKSLIATENLAEVFSSTGIVFFALPSVFVRSTLEPLAGCIPRETVIVNLSKGIDAETAETSFQIVSLMFPGNRCVMLSGPSIANEIARQMPTVVVIAGNDRPALELTSRVLENDYFKVSVSYDVAGVELGGILKNIYAIGLGIFDGARIKSVNFRSVYLTLALEEMIKFGVKRGARAETFSYIAGLGDLFATSISGHSHNRRMGELLARGYSIGKVRRKMGVLPEGYNTLKAVLKIAQQMKLVLPVAKDLNAVIDGRMETRRFIDSVIKDERVYYESGSRH